MINLYAVLELVADLQVGQFSMLINVPTYAHQFKLIVNEILGRNAAFFVIRFNKRYQGASYQNLDLFFSLFSL